MNLSIMLRRFIRPLLIVAIAATWSCSDETNSDLPFAPYDCVEQEPNVSPFEVLVTITTEFRTVPIAIYRGTFEDNNVVVRDTVSARSNKYQLFTETEYSAAAAYVIGADTVLVIDGDKITTSSTEYRDRTCWNTTDGVVDLQLRVRP